MFLKLDSQAVLYCNSQLDRKISTQLGLNPRPGNSNTELPVSDILQGGVTRTNLDSVELTLRYYTLASFTYEKKLPSKMPWNDAVFCNSCKFSTLRLLHVKQKCTLHSLFLTKRLKIHSWRKECTNTLPFVKRFSVRHRDWKLSLSCLFAARSVRVSKRSVLHYGLVDW